MLPPATATNYYVLMINLLSWICDKLYLGEDAVNNIIKNMVEESKYCSNVMKKRFSKKLVMIKEDDKYFQNSTKCSICDYVHVDGDVKVRDHCHITGKYRGYAHRDCNISVLK